MNYSSLQPEYMWACDIETAGNSKAGEFHKKFAKDIKAPKNYTDEKKIEEYIANKKAELGSKDALSWMTGKVVSIALTNVKDIGEGVKNPRTIAFVGFDEKKVLESFAAEMNKGENGIFQLVGKTSNTFDFPFLKGRLMANGINTPSEMMNGYNLLDIDKMICPSMGSNQTGSLAKYAFALGLDGKLMTGADVPRLYAEAVAEMATGDKAKAKEIMLKIKAYNIQDANITAAIAYKLIKQGI